MTTKNALIGRVEAAGEGAKMPPALKKALQKLTAAELELLRDFVETTEIKAYSRGQDAERVDHERLDPVF